MIQTRLPRHRSREKHDRSQLAKRLDEAIRACARQMLCNFQAQSEIKPLCEREWFFKIYRAKAVTGNEQLGSLNILPVNTYNRVDAMVTKHGEPSTCCTTYIHDTRWMNEIQHDRNHDLGS